MKKLFPYLLIVLEFLIIILIYSYFSSQFGFYGEGYKTVYYPFYYSLYYLLLLLPINSLLLIIFGIIKIKKDSRLARGMILFGLIGLFFSYPTLSIPNGKPGLKNIIVRMSLYNIENQAYIVANTDKSHTSFQDICNNKEILRVINNLKFYNKKGAPVLCFSDKDSFVIATEYKKAESDGSKYFCIDSALGTKEDIDESYYSKITSADTSCQSQ